MKFLLLLPVLALCELYLLIKLGSAIGAFNVVLWVVLSILIGAGIIRNQGMDSLMNLRAQAQNGKGLHIQLLDTALVIIAGFLVLLPGLITDFCGAMLLVPWVREQIRERIQQQAWVVTESYTTFEGEYKERKDDDQRLR